jgi:hypothetical protein
MISHIVDLHDVRVPQSSQGFYLAPEAVKLSRLRTPSGEEHFDGDRSIEAAMAG